LDILQLFFPEVGVGLVRGLYTVFNLAVIFGALCFGAFLALRTIRHFRGATNKEDAISWRELLVPGVAMVALTAFLLYLKHISGSEGDGGNAIFFHTIFSFIEPLLALENIGKTPFFNLFGFNLAVRFAIIFGLVWACVRAKVLAEHSSRKFSVFLEKKFFTFSDDAEKVEDSEKHAPAGKVESAEKSKPKQGRAINSTFTATGGVVGIILIYLLGIAEVRSTMVDILTLAKNLFEAITLAGKIDGTGDVSTPILLQNCFYMLVSIFIFAIYVAIVVSLAIAIRAIWEKKKKIGEWVFDHRKKVLICVAVLALLVSAIVLMFIITTSYGSIEAAFNAMFAGGVGPFLKMIAYVGLLSIAICVLLMLVTLAFTSTGFIVWFAFSQIAKTLWKLAEERKEKISHVLSTFPKMLLLTFREGVRAVEIISLTLLRLFTGYKDDNEKNHAVYLAAAFASVASMLNTFLGLNSFFTDDNNPIITAICSFAIAAAVQFLVLIAGMKAGESLSDWLNARRLKGDKVREIITRVFGCLVSIGVYIAVCVAVGIIRVNFLRIFIPAFGGLLLLYNLIIQGMTIYALYKTRKEGFSADPASVDNECQTHKSIPGGVAFAISIMMIVVSTGFAYNNMFKYFAATAHVHQNVYNQVISKADEEFGIVDALAEMSSEYSSNAIAMLNQIQERYSELTEMRSIVEKKNNENISVATPESDGRGVIRAENIRDEFRQHLKAFDSLVSALSMYLNSNYEDVSASVGSGFEIYSYGMYWQNNPHLSTELRVFNLNGSIIGEKLTSLPLSSDITYTLPAGHKIYNADWHYTESITSINADKYAIIRTLYDYFLELDNYITSKHQTIVLGIEDSGSPSSNGIVSQSGTEGTGSQNGFTQFYTVLGQNEAIDSTVASVVEAVTAQGNTASSSGAGNVKDIIRLVGGYLNSSSQFNNHENQGSALENEDNAWSAKQAGYAEMAEYLERSKVLYNILLQYTSASEMENVDKSETRSPTTKVSIYQNYALGINESDFKLSYDTLFGGGFGTNPDGEIDALYSSQPIAIFLLIICALIDFSAFFSGILVVRDVIGNGNSIPNTNMEKATGGQEEEQELETGAEQEKESVGSSV